MSILTGIGVEVILSLDWADGRGLYSDFAISALPLGALRFKVARILLKSQYLAVTPTVGPFSSTG